MNNNLPSDENEKPEIEHEQIAQEMEQNGDLSQGGNSQNNNSRYKYSPLFFAIIALIALFVTFILSSTTVLVLRLVEEASNFIYVIFAIIAVVRALKLKKAGEWCKNDKIALVIGIGVLAFLAFICIFVFLSLMFIILS